MSEANEGSVMLPRARVRAKREPERYVCGRGEAEFEERSDEGLGFAEVPAGSVDFEENRSKWAENASKWAKIGRNWPILSHFGLIFGLFRRNFGFSFPARRFSFPARNLFSSPKWARNEISFSTDFGFWGPKWNFFFDLEIDFEIQNEAHFWSKMDPKWPHFDGICDPKWTTF